MGEFLSLFPLERETLEHLAVCRKKGGGEREGYGLAKAWLDAGVNARGLANGKAGRCGTLASGDWSRGCAEAEKATVLGWGGVRAVRGV